MANNLEPVNSRQNNLSPRAKIGDVVIVSSYQFHDSDDNTLHYVEGEKKLEISDVLATKGILDDRLYESKEEYYFEDQDILKNLTTNVSYE